MKAIIIANMLLVLAGTALASFQVGDILKFDGQTYEIPVFPLEDYKPIAEGKINLMIEPGTMSSAHCRGYVATWEIADGKLWLVGIDGWIDDFDSYVKKAREMIKSGDTNYITYTKSKTSSNDYYRKATLEDILPGQVKSGRLHATWFSGRLFYPGLRWGGKFNPEEKAKQESEASLVITVKDGVVTQIDNRMKSQQSAPPLPRARGGHSEGER